MATNDGNDASPPLPRVSVVIAAYNAEPFIARAIESVQRQTLQDFEIVVADDRSTDGTCDALEILSSRDPRIRLMRAERNGGPSAARNRAIAAARGRWVAVLDADDAYAPQRLARLVDVAEANDLDMVADDIIYYDRSADRMVGRGGVEAGSDWRRFDLREFLRTSLYRRPLTDLSGRGHLQYALLKFLFRRSFLVQNRLGYPEAIRDGEDFFLYTECLVAGARAGLVADAGYLYTQRVGSMSGEASGQTRTVVDRSQAVGGVAELLKRHADRFGPAETRLLRGRQQQAMGLQDYEMALMLNRARGRSAAIAAVLRRPATWGFVAQALVQRIRRR